MKTIIITRNFNTWDASGVVSGEKGDKLEVRGGTADRLIALGLAKEYVPRKEKEKGE